MNSWDEAIANAKQPKLNAWDAAIAKKKKPNKAVAAVKGAVREFGRSYNETEGLVPDVDIRLKNHPLLKPTPNIGQTTMRQMPKRSLAQRVHESVVGKAVESLGEAAMFAPKLIGQAAYAGLKAQGGLSPEVEDRIQKAQESYWRFQGKHSPLAIVDPESAAYIGSVLARKMPVSPLTVGDVGAMVKTIPEYTPFGTIKSVEKLRAGDVAGAALPWIAAAGAARFGKAPKPPETRLARYERDAAAPPEAPIEQRALPAPERRIVARGKSVKPQTRGPKQPQALPEPVPGQPTEWVPSEPNKLAAVATPAQRAAALARKKRLKVAGEKVAALEKIAKQQGKVQLPVVEKPTPKLAIPRQIAKAPEPQPAPPAAPEVAPLGGIIPNVSKEKPLATPAEPVSASGETGGDTVTVYHGTETNNRPTGNWKVGTFFAPDTAFANIYAQSTRGKGKPLLLKVTLPKDAVELTERGEYRLTREVPIVAEETTHVPKATPMYRGAETPELGKGSFPGTWLSLDKAEAAQYGPVSKYDVRVDAPLDIDAPHAQSLAESFLKRHPEVDQYVNEIDDLWLFPPKEWVDELRGYGYDSLAIGKTRFVFDNDRVQLQPPAPTAPVRPGVTEPAPRATPAETPAPAKEVTTNPNYNPEHFQFQNEHIERLPKSMENRDLGFALEASGDLFRELTERKWPALDYIAEKVRRIDRVIKDAERFANADTGFNMTLRSAGKDAELANELTSRFGELADVGPGADKARRLSVALASGDARAARSAFNDFVDDYPSLQQKYAPDLAGKVEGVEVAPVESEVPVSDTRKRLVAKRDELQSKLDALQEERDGIRDQAMSQPLASKSTAELGMELMDERGKVWMVGKGKRLIPIDAEGQPTGKGRIWKPEDNMRPSPGKAVYDRLVNLNRDAAYIKREMKDVQEGIDTEFHGYLVGEEVETRNPVTSEWEPGTVMGGGEKHLSVRVSGGVYRFSPDMVRSLDAAYEEATTPKPPPAKPAQVAKPAPPVAKSATSEKAGAGKPQIVVHNAKVGDFYEFPNPPKELVDALGLSVSKLKDGTPSIGVPYHDARYHAKLEAAGIKVVSHMSLEQAKASSLKANPTPPPTVAKASGKGGIIKGVSAKKPVAPSTAKPAKATGEAGGKVYYHGGSAQSIPDVMGGRHEGISYTPHQNVAEGYASSHPNGKVVAVRIKPTAKVIDATAVDSGWHDIPIDEWQKIWDAAESKGVDLSGNYEASRNDPLTWEALFDEGVGAEATPGLASLLRGLGYDVVRTLDRADGIRGDIRKRGGTIHGDIPDQSESLVVLNPESVESVNPKPSAPVKSGASTPTPSPTRTPFTDAAEAAKGKKPTSLLDRARKDTGLGLAELKENAKQGILKQQLEKQLKWSAEDAGKLIGELTGKAPAAETFKVSWQSDFTEQNGELPGEFKNEAAAKLAAADAKRKNPGRTYSVISNQRGGVGGKTLKTMAAVGLGAAVAGIPAYHRWRNDPDNYDPDKKVLTHQNFEGGVLSDLQDAFGIVGAVVPSIVKGAAIGKPEKIPQMISQQTSFTEALPWWAGLIGDITLDPTTYVAPEKVLKPVGKVTMAAANKLRFPEKARLLASALVEHRDVRELIDFLEYKAPWGTITLRQSTKAARQLLEREDDARIVEVGNVVDKAKDLAREIQKAGKHADLDVGKLVDAGWKESARAAEGVSEGQRRAAVLAAKKQAYEEIYGAAKARLGSAEKARKYAQKVKSLYDRVNDLEASTSQALVDAGVFSDETARLWRQTHLKRIYERFQDVDDYIDMLRKVNPAEAEKLYQSTKALKAGYGAGKKLDLNVVRQRKDLSQEIRDLLVEIPYASARLVVGQGKSAELAARAKMFTRLAEKVAIDEAQAEKLGYRGYVQISPELQVLVGGGQVPSSKYFGALAGKYVPEPLFYDLMASVPKKPNILAKWNAKAVSLWKMGKVPLSFATSVRNTITNVALADMLGKTSPVRLDIYAEALKSLAKKDKWYQEAKKSGVFLHDTFVHSEIGDIVELAGKDPYSKWQRLKQAAAFLPSKAGALYQANEQWFKMAVYINARKYGMEAQDAAQFADHALFNYRKMPGALNNMRRHGIMPFVAFPYKAIPAMTKAIYEDWGRVSKYAKTQAAVESMTPVKERAKERAVMPDFMKTGEYMRLPTSTRRYLQTGYFNPFQPISQASMSDLVNFVSPLEAMREDLKNNTSSLTGRTLIEPGLPDSEIRKQQTKFIAQFALPSLTPGIGYGYKAFTDKEVGNEPRSMKERIAAGAGFKTRSLSQDLTREAASIYFGVKEAEKQARTAARRTAKNKAWDELPVKDKRIIEGIIAKLKRKMEAAQRRIDGMNK